MGEILKQTVNSAKWTYLSSFANKGIQFVIGIILARLLTPSDYGLLGMLAIFMAIASTFIDSGMGNALIRKKEASDADYNTVFYFNIVISIIAYGVLFLSAPFIADFYNTPLLKDIVRVISLNLVIGAFGAVQGAKFTKDLSFKTLALISISTSIISGVIGISFAYWGFGVWALVYQQISSNALGALFKWFFSTWKPAWTFSIESFKELFGYGSKLLLSGLLHTVYANLTTLLIGKFYKPSQLGYYSRGENFPSMVQGSVIGPLLSVTFPIIAKYHKDDSHLAYLYSKYIRGTSLPIYFLLILLAALSKPIILILLTDEWAPAIPYMQIFCFAYLAENVTLLNLNVLYVKGRSDLFLRLEIVKKSISLTMLLCAVPFGVMAICIAKLVYSQIAVFINTHYTGKLLNLGYWQQIKDFGPYIFYSVIAVTPAYLLTMTNLNNWTTCILGALTAVAIYWTIMHVTHNDIYEQYFIGKIIPKMKKTLKWTKAK